MIAIIVEASEYPEMYGLDEHLPLSLFPLVDRPILHHIIEYLVTQGITQFEFLLNHLPEAIEANLGNGARWGCSFSFHLFPSAGKAYSLAQTIASGLDDEVVLGRANCLPELTIERHRPSTMFFAQAGNWTGWITLPRHSTLIAGIDRDPDGTFLLADCAKVVVDREMTFRTGTELLQSQHDLLSGTFTGLMIGGRQTEPGVWISRNVSLHPTANVVGPVYIGPNCRIGRGARIGPSAVISENCILDEQSSVENSLVAPGTYIGQGLELEQVIVDRNRLVNVRIGTSLLVSESFLLSGLTEHTTHYRVQRMLSRLGALALIVVLWPVASLIILYLLIAKKGALSYDRALRIPTENNPSVWHEYRIPCFRMHAADQTDRWTGFFLHLWPGLISVLKGDLFLVGVQHRSRQEVEALPNDWRAIYLKSKCGLITEASVMFGDAPSKDELYTAEAYYSATANVSHDLHLALIYFWRLIIGPVKPTPTLARDAQL